MRSTGLLFVVGLLVFGWATPAAAIFLFLPLGAIADALETDPEKATYSARDRAFAKCAGYHINQALGPAEKASFHDTLAEKAIEASADKVQVKNVASTYSRRWSKAARVDAQTNRAYGRDLANSCVQVSLPRTQSEEIAMQVKKEEERQRAAAEQAERLRLEALTQAAEMAAAEAAAIPAATAPPPPDSVGAESPVVQVDFTREAGKASRILGCTPMNLKVVGAENSNILYDVTCATAAKLRLASDPSGLCLGR